jgi:hypothetical protein
MTKNRKKRGINLSKGDPRGQALLAHRAALTKTHQAAARASVLYVHGRVLSSAGCVQSGRPALEWALFPVRFSVPATLRGATAAPHNGNLVDVFYNDGVTTAHGSVRSCGDASALSCGRTPAWKHSV